MAEKYFVTTADAGMTEQLKALWKNVFGDTDEYISLFFEKRFTPSQCVAAISGGKVVGMLFLLPFDLVCGNERYSGRYIYAVATHPDHRRQGISEAMLSFAHKKAEDEGAALSALVPANAPLFDYYRKRGFETEFYKKELTLYPDSDVKSGQLSRCRLEEQLKTRRKLFADSRMFVDWDKAALCYQQLENELLGGETLCFSSPKKGYALCIAGDDGVFIREWGADALYPELISAISERYQKRKITVRLAADKSDSEAVPFAMTKWYITERKASGDDPPFISLVLD
ncbi:MAG: GNAT family N-acetyltransferase [Oscillospiraceae bacterium]|nr:GNAT family N-acetyltransferase [Oscillospiraceae bacterium]